MGLTDDRTGPVGVKKHPLVTGVDPITKATADPLNRQSARQRHPFEKEDYGAVIHAFEVESTNQNQEISTQAPLYKDVYSTRRFSERVRRQMDYYPGMHQSNYPPREDPAYTVSQDMASNRMNKWDRAMDSPAAFMNGLRANKNDFDYTKIFGTDVSAEERAKQFGKMITECIPCFNRPLDLNGLVPDGDLLEVHALNLKIRSDLLEEIKDLFGNPSGMSLDICELLKLFSSLCPSDLVGIIAVLSQYLAKMNLDIRFNIDFIANLIGPILSPFLDGLAQWLDKWIQLILEPMLCIVDHMNETIALGQSMKVPFSEARVNFESEQNVALPNNVDKLVPGVGGAFEKENMTRSLKFGADASTQEAWSEGEVARFNTPQDQKYNPNIPEYPTEESLRGGLEVAATSMDAVGHPIPEEDRQAADVRWKELREAEKEKRRRIPPPEKYSRRDGTRWSKDDVPASEKDEASFRSNYHPPEAQDPAPKRAAEYWDPAPVANAIVQTRNILQGAIQYMNDWFTFITQMIYDLLGTDAGWMTKKLDTTKKKNDIIQIIGIIKAILEAWSKNGLECGLDTNFDTAQAKYILEDTLNKTSPTQFKVKENGDIEVIPPGRKPLPETTDDSELAEPTNESGIYAGPDIGTVDDKAKAREVKQKSVQSGIIVKNCLKDVTKEDLSRATEWIAEFERGLSNA